MTTRNQTWVLCVAVAVFVVCLWVMPTHGNIALGLVYAVIAGLCWAFGKHSTGRRQIALYGATWGSGVAAFGAITIPFLPFLRILEVWLRTHAS